MYDALKFTALILLPLISALYYGLGKIWHFPAVEEVIASIAILDTVLGGLISKLSSNYFTNATIAEAVVGFDEDGASEVRRIVQTSNEPIIFEDGAPLLMRARLERDE